MQATGVYWMALYQVLDSYGLQVYVVNAKYTKTLPGRKTDVLECQWLQKLMSLGGFRVKLNGFFGGGNSIFGSLFEQLVVLM